MLSTGKLIIQRICLFWGKNLFIIKRNILTFEEFKV